MQRDKETEAFNKRMLDEVNNTLISTEEMIEAAQVVGELKPEDFPAHHITIVGLHRNDPMKSKSIIVRIDALAHFLFEEDASGWTLPLPDGSVLAQEAVLSAAGVHPVSEREGVFYFERESFLRKVLELADLDKVG